MATKKKNMDAHLAEIFKQFIALKDDDLKRSQEVFKSVFEEVKKVMGEKDNYFQKYSSQVLYAGSVYDGIKVSKLDEFDMDIVIRLPVSYEQIALERDRPGFVRLRIGQPFDLLDKQPEWEKCHKVTREWRDADKYFLQNKFRQWMHGIVQKALNEMNGKVTVNGVTYLLKYKESGPAYTLNISGESDAFLLDVDLVPVIRFLHPRWPEGYRQVEGNTVKDWLVVPKPNKAARDEAERSRSWRLSFQDFEREMMKGCQQLKTTIRLLKKLRDALGMKAIASYYIKTLFLWKVHDTKNDKKFWQNKLSVTFRIMVEELRDAIKDKNIRYYWHEKNNLIEGLKPTLQKVYLDKLNEVVNAITANDVDKIVLSLLTPAEMEEFKKTEFYQKQSLRDSVDSPASVSRQSSVASNSPARQQSTSSSNQSSQESGGSKTDHLLKILIDKIDGLTDKVLSLEERMTRLEKTSNLGKNNILDEDILRLSMDTRALQLDDYEKLKEMKNTIINNDVKASDSNLEPLINF